MKPELFDDPIFENLEPHRIHILKKMATDLPGKSVPQILLIIGKNVRSLQKGRDLTHDEQEAMKKVIYESLDDDDKESFDKVSKILEKMY